MRKTKRDLQEKGGLGAMRCFCADSSNNSEKRFLLSLLVVFTAIAVNEILKYVVGQPKIAIRITVVIPLHYIFPSSRSSTCHRILSMRFISSAIWCWFSEYHSNRSPYSFELFHPFQKAFWSSYEMVHSVRSNLPNNTLSVPQMFIERIKRLQKLEFISFRAFFVLLNYNLFTVHRRELG